MWYVVSLQNIILLRSNIRSYNYSCPQCVGARVATFHVQIGCMLFYKWSLCQNNTLKIKTTRLVFISQFVLLFYLMALNKYLYLKYHHPFTETISIYLSIYIYIYIYVFAELNHQVLSLEAYLWSCHYTEKKVCLGKEIVTALNTVFRYAKKRRRQSRWTCMRAVVVPNCFGWWLWLILAH
jgi:hypothetical protein